MKTALMSLTLVAALATGSACGRNRATTEIDPNAPTIVRVDNQAFNDMTIYVVPDVGSRLRLGIATGHSEAKFTIPKHLVTSITSLRFFADPIGGNRTPVSEQIQVSPGDEVILRIPPS